MTTRETIERAVTKAMSWQPSENGPSYVETRDAVVSMLTALSPPEPTEGLREVLKAALTVITDGAHAQCASYNRSTKEYEFDDEMWALSAPATFDAAVKLRAALRAMPLQQQTVYEETRQKVTAARERSLAKAVEFLRLVAFANFEPIDGTRSGTVMFTVEELRRIREFVGAVPAMVAEERGEKS